MDRPLVSPEQVTTREQADPTGSPSRESLYRLLVESVSDYAIFLLDPNGFISSWNPGARRIKGYEAGEIIGRHFSIFYPMREVKRGKPEYGLRVAATEGRWEEEGWRIRKDGTPFWASVVITALRDEQGELLGFAKVTRDLTERKEAEDERAQLLALERAARKDSEAHLERLRVLQTLTEAALVHLDLKELMETLLERIVDSLSVDTAAILLLEDPERTTLLARAAKGIEEEVEQGVRIPVGRGFAGRVAAERGAIVVDDVDHADVLNPLLREKGIHSLLGVPLMAGSNVLGVLHVGSLHHRSFSEQDTQLLQIVADRVAMAIEHARLIEDVRTARQEAEIAEASLRARDEFLSVAAHELKTPITSLQIGVQAQLRRLRRSAQPDPAQLQRTFLAVERQTTKLSRLVTQLLETVRLQAGRMELRHTPVNLTELVAAAVESAQQLTERHELVLTAPELILADVDEMRFDQVVSNLLDNAIKFSPDGGRIEVELTQPSAGVVRLAVRDSGLGVAPEHRPHLFERFYQAHGKEHRSGMGVGLFICREIVEMHGGQIGTEFPPEGGTRVVLEIPAAQPSARKEPGEAGLQPLAY